MSLSEICKSVLQETGWPTYPSIASNSDGTAQQIFAIANTELKQLSQEKRWPHLEVEYEFLTVPGQAEYPWPEDFDSVSFGGVFEASQYYQVRGGMNFEDWARLRYGKLSSISTMRFRQVYREGVPTMVLSPTPTSVQTLVALYFSKDFARDVDGVSKRKFDQDSDTAKVPEDLVELGVKWRFRRAKGLDFSAELAEYSASINQRFVKYSAPADIIIGGNEGYDYMGITQGYVPDTGFGQ